MRSNARDFKSDSVDVVPVSEAVAMFGNSTAEGMMSVATDAALLTYCKSNKYKACDSLLSESETEASESAAEHLSNSNSNSRSSAELNSNSNTDEVGALSK